MPMKPCAYAGCKTLVDIGQSHCKQHVSAKRESGRVSDARRSDRPSRRWYNLKAWKVKRAALLAREPLCRMCPSGSKRPATIADHVVPHKENYVLFWEGDLQPLCKPCHDSTKQRLDKGGGSKL